MWWWCFFLRVWAVSTGNSDWGVKYSPISNDKMKAGMIESETVMHSMRLADNTKMDENQVEKVHTGEVEPNCRYDSKERQQK